MSNIVITRKDVFWGYLSQILQFGAGFFILPMILVKLEVDELAIWYVFISITFFINLLDFGFQPTIMRNITYAYSGANVLYKTGLSEDKLSNTINYDLLKSIILTAKQIYKLISFFAFFILLIFGTLYITSLSDKILNPTSVYSSWFIYIISASLNLYFSYFVPLLQGSGKIKESHQVIVYSRIIYITISFIGLYLGYGLIAVAISNLISSMTRFFFSKRKYFTNEIVKQIRSANITYTNKELFNILWHNSYRNGLVSLGSFLILRANTLIVTKFFPFDIAANYGLTIMCINLISNFSKIYFNTYIPKINQYRINFQYKKMIETYSFGNVIAIMLFVTGSIFVNLFGNKLLIFVGSESRLLTLYSLILLQIITLLEINHTIAATMITTSNQVPFVKSSIISGISIIVLSLISVVLYRDVYLIILSQGIVQLLYNNWKWPAMILKQFKLNLFNFYIIGIKKVISIIILKEGSNAF